MLSVGLCAQLACIWEATACKPGNVHRYQDFEDVTYLDFLASAAAVGPVLEVSSRRRVGETVLEGVRATRRIVMTNTNLGILLLLAPLAAVQQADELRSGVERILSGLDLDDARAVYRAIRIATPGGIGRVSEQDIHNEPSLPLRQIMGLAADRDLVARQYVNGFREVFDEGAPALLSGIEETQSLQGGIIACHLRLMASYPDSLISRKAGRAEAKRASRQAQAVFKEGWPKSWIGWRALAGLDGWLRDPSHRRNPGTTADLVTACLFVALREGRIPVPPQYPWTGDFLS